MKEAPEWNTNYTWCPDSGHEHEHGDGVSKPCDYVICKFGSNYLPAIGGYNTRMIIEKTDYKSDLGKEFYEDNGTEKTVKPEHVFRVWGDDSEVQGIVDAYNNLGKLNIYSLEPAKVENLSDYSQITNALKAASSTGNTSELNAWFTLRETDFTPEGWVPLSVDKVYTRASLRVTENSSLVAKIEVAKLDFELFKDGLEAANLDEQFSKGIVIGDSLYITVYDVAVFEGFRETSVKGSYAPIFTYRPESFSNDEPPVGLVGRSDLFRFTESDTVGKLEENPTRGTIDGKPPIGLQVDFASGVLLNYGSKVGQPNSFVDLSVASILGVPASRFKRLGVDTNYISPSYSGSTYTTESVDVTEKFAERVNSSMGTDGVPYSQPLFVLMDYLELVYSPGVVGNEPLVAYGRKVRLGNDLIGSSPVTLTGAIATVGASETGDGYNLSLRDFIDVCGIFDDDGKPKSIDEETPADMKAFAAVRYMDGYEAGYYLSGDTSAERGDRLPQVAAGSGINCVLKFGSSTIDILDDQSGNADAKQTPLYGIALYGGLYDRGLFSNWINVSGNTNLDGWVKTASELGYPNYNISGATLTEQLRGNYAFELAEDGILSLDLDTIVKINEERVENRRGYGVMILRTVLLVLGFFYMAYVSVLLAAWALDVNMDFGLNILEKVSLGHFVAVRSLDEMPEHDPESKTTYVDFRGIVMRCIAFAFFGIFLVTLDPVGLIVRLMEGLDFLFNEISKLIFGTSIF